MALEELIGKDAVKSIAGRPFGIDPKIEYDANSKEIRVEFVKRAGDLFDVEEYFQKLKENSNDVTALNDLAGVALNYMAGNKNENLVIMRDPHMALEQADVLLDTGYKNMAKFIENNRDDILDKLSAKDLYNIVNNPNLPFFLTKDKDHNKILLLRSKIMEMQQASQKNGDVGSVIQKELGDLINHIPEEQKKFLQRNSSAYLNSMTHAVNGEIQKAYGALFKLSDKKTLDKSALKKFLEDNYEVIEDIMKEDDRSEGEVFSRWDKNLKIHYVELARQLYSPEKKQAKRDKDEDKEDRNDSDKKLGVKT